MAKQRSNPKQEAFHRFLSQMEREDRSFTMADIVEHTGYPLKGTVKAKVSRSEWKNVLERIGPDEFKAKPVQHLSKAEFAHLCSVKEMHEPEALPLSGKLLEKSTHAALSAMEVYNKPDFKYREESFCILMVNAWELLLKAKLLHENKEEEACLWQKDKEDNVVRSRSGNPRTVTIGEAITAAQLDPVLCDHLFALIEFRDNAIHLLNDSPMLKLKVQEVGTASLRNYLELVQEWFSTDLSRYNFYLMPMSFFHPHELQSYSINTERKQHRNLLRYIGELEAKQEQQADPRFSIGLELRTEFVKSKLRYAPDDPNAISVKIESEEAFRLKYPWRYKEELIPALNKRYKDFKVGPKFYALKKRIEVNTTCSGERHLDWNNPKGQKKRFYSPNIMKEFDKHYTKAKP